MGKSFGFSNCREQLEQDEENGKRLAKVGSKRLEAPNGFTKESVPGFGSWLDNVNFWKYFSRHKLGGSKEMALCLFVKG